VEEWATIALKAATAWPTINRHTDPAHPPPLSDDKKSVSCTALRTPDRFSETVLHPFFLFFLHPSDFFRPFPRTVLPVKGLAMNSGCVSAL
jgi:hypothetical protein